MKNTKTPLYLIIFVLTLLLSISLIKTSQMTQKTPKTEFIEVRDTLTEIKWDTITLSKEKNGAATGQRHSLCLKERYPDCDRLSRSTTTHK